MSDKKYRLETLAIHAGYTPDETGARAVPVHRTSSYVFRDTEHAANLFGLKELGNIYTRLMNPTQSVLEQRVAAMYGAPAALAASSGTAATHYSIINICQQGDHVVSANDLYGGTYTMFDSIHPQFGIETTFVDPTKPENFDAAIKKNTRAIFVETCANPELKVPDFDGIAAVAKRHRLPLICDNTFATSALFNPFSSPSSTSRIPPTTVCATRVTWAISTPSASPCA
jgi:O-acetylhomoserine (thiol)-lyase